MRSAAIWIAAVVISMALGWLTVRPFAHETWATSWSNGTEPIQPWLPAVWPTIALINGIFTTVFFRVPIKRIPKLAGLTLLLFFSFYICAIIMSFTLGEDGLLGLTWAHGGDGGVEASTSSSTFKAMELCPMMLVGGALMGSIFVLCIKNPQQPPP